jgi:uncharacterized protein (DUF736 family)
MSFDNRDRGALFRNNDKNHDDDHAPDYRGSINVAGTEHWLNAWIKTSKAGEKYMSLSVRPKETPRLKRMPAEDEQPF